MKRLLTHRHLRERPFMGLPEVVEMIKEHGELWHIKGPFKYCPLCKCVPTTFTGQHVEAEAVPEESDA